MSYDNKIYDPTKSADLELSIHQKEKYFFMGRPYIFSSKCDYTICIFKNLDKFIH